MKEAEPMKKFIPLLIFSLILAGCAGQTPPPAEEPSSDASPTNGDSIGGTDFKPVKLDDLGPAPELENETWLNTDQPLRLADLRGKVVLLDMWTFG